MSMENVKKFMELVKAEESLAKRMVALKDGLQEGEFNFKNDKEFVEKKILPLAKEYDLEFSVEDFIEFTNSQLTSLSEEELAEVSGGFIGECFAALAIALGSSAAVAAVKNVGSFFTGSGTSTSTVQSVTEQDVDMSGAAGAEEKSNKIAFDERFKEIKKEFSKKIKAAFKGVTSYMSPEDRSTWIEGIAKQHKQINPREDKYVNSRYNKANDRIEFTATWTDRLNNFMDPTKYSQAALNGKLSNNLAQQYKEAYGSDSTKLLQNWNNLNQQLETKQEEKAGYEGKIKDLTQKNTELQRTVGYCYNQLIQVCKALIKANPYNNYQFNQWKQALQNKTFTSWDALKEQAAGYSTTENGQPYNCSGYVDTLLSATQQIQNNNNQISQLQNSAKQAQTEIQQILNISNHWQTHTAKQQAFNDNMKTEFDYFYGELVKALKEDEEISKLAKEATTTEAKANLANKIKGKADQLVQAQFSKQLLTGCSLVVEQQGDSIGMKIVYRGYWVHQNSFSVDEFISAENHTEIVHSASSKKREEIISKIANYVNSTSSSSSDLKLAVQSVFEQIEKKTLELGLGVDITTANNKSITFSFTSGGKTLTTSFGVNAVVDKCNQLKNMQAMEATRQQNEGTIEYTPFGHKLWNSIGSQAQHVLNTIAQIEQATDNLSDVKDRKAFENDLKYVADRILIQGNTPYGLKGDHHTDTSIKAKDLQKIQEFASKIGQ